MKRHNELMEAAALGKKGSGMYKKCTKCKGRGLYLYKKLTGSCFFGKKITDLSNYDIGKLVKKLEIKNFRRAFLRDLLPNKC
jgi:hypothetical protein